MQSEEEGDLDSAAATRVEAEHLASMISRWLTPTEPGGEAAVAGTRLRPGHIALLFRKLTQAEEYLKPFDGMRFSTSSTGRSISIAGRKLLTW